MGDHSATMTADDLGPNGRVVRLTIPAKAEYISLSRLALAGLSRVRALPDETLADLKLALTEACSNSVRHAYDGGEGHVDISFDLRDARLLVEVADDGTGFAPGEPGGNGGDDELSEGGLGIAIIRSIADEVEIGGGANGRGSRLRFVKLL
ncbi:MAG: anti-sigma B factor RsbW [Thermoleophilia bacterium]|nr:anti-sigma B factor RsbW [Thermoleophilia bacterium]